MDFLRHALTAEFRTEAGRVNSFFGTLTLALLILSYVPTVGDYVTTVFVIVFRPHEPVPAAPKTPAWGVLVFFVYTLFCVIYVGVKARRRRR